MSYLYFIQAGGADGPVKIGHSANVEKRLAQLQTGSPHPLRLLAKFDLDDAAALERRYHWLLSEYRLEGEWFSPSNFLTNIITVLQLGEQLGIHARERAARSAFLSDVNSRPSTDDNPTFCCRCNRPVGSDALACIDFDGPGEEEIEVRHADRKLCAAHPHDVWKFNPETDVQP